jgi:hypothetical protein
VSILALVILYQYILDSFELDLPFFFVIIESELYALLCKSLDFEIFNVFQQHIIWVNSEKLADGQGLRCNLLACDETIREN